MGSKRDLTGMRFARLVVLHEVSERIRGGLAWECECDCGVICTIMSAHLIRGNSKSCGCLKQEIFLSHARTHGMSKTPEFRTWRAMKSRCCNPGNTEFKNYGGRGITICDRWLNSFENFYADMGAKPTPGHSIERKNNNGNYEPCNCYWATKQEQVSNTRRSRFLVMDGRRQTASQWARELSVNLGTVLARLDRGLSDVEALTKVAVYARRQRMEHDV